jgi:hypothetical protein
MEDLSSFLANCSEHQVSLLVLDGVVETMFWNAGQGLNEWLCFANLGVRNGDKVLSCHWADDRLVLLSTNPLTVDKVHTSVRGLQVVWI